MGVEDSTYGQLLYATTLLRATDAKGKIEVGTAFLLDYDVDNGNCRNLLVTCHHVVRGSVKVEFFFTALRKDVAGRAPDTGRRITVTLEQPESWWFSHPNKDIDVAVMPLEPILNRLRGNDADCFLTAIPSSSCPKPEHENMFDVREQVAFVGYPYGYFDEAHLLPLVRSGWTASSINLPYNMLPGFYVDAHFHPGSSGSPVLLTAPLYATDDKTGFVRELSRSFLVGMATSSDPAPSGPYSGQEMGLGFAFNSYAILDCADHYQTWCENEAQRR